MVPLCTIFLKNGTQMVHNAPIFLKNATWEWFIGTEMVHNAPIFLKKWVHLKWKWYHFLERCTHFSKKCSKWYHLQSFWPFGTICNHFDHLAPFATIYSLVFSKKIRAGNGVRRVPFATIFLKNGCIMYHLQPFWAFATILSICNHFEHLQPFPHPLLAFIDSPEILENPLQYIHSESMDFFDFREMQGGAWGPAGRALDPPMAPYGFPMAPHGIPAVPFGCPEAPCGAPTDSPWRCMRRHVHPLCEPRRSLDACCLPARDWGIGTIFLKNGIMYHYVPFF